MRLLPCGTTLLLLAASACSTRPSPRTCQTVLDCAVSDQCTGGLCEALNCSSGLTPCSGACVDLAGAGSSCGACGHDCGGGLCSAGVCQPAVLRDGLSYPVFDVDATTLYFHSGDKVLSCPLAGCGALAPHQIGAITAPILGGNAGGVLLAGGGNVVFMADALTGTSGPNLQACPIQAGCTTPPLLLKSTAHQGFSGGYAMDGGDAYWGWYKDVQHSTCDGLGACSAAENLLAAALVMPAPLAADASGVYFADPAAPSDLLRCPRSGACTPETVAASAPAFTALQARSGKVYMLASGRDGYNDGAIRSCPEGATGCTPALLVGNQSFPLAFTVDGNAVSWLLRDAPAGGAPMSIVTCPVAGCSGGPRLLAAGQIGAYGLRSDDRFVYWATPTQILRVAK